MKNNDHPNPSGNSRPLYSVGELARTVGVTVRTLQYYDRENLLRAEISEGGRRMYTREDVLKLQQILFLKSLGFPLDEIREKILRQQNSVGLEEIFREQRDILLHQIESRKKIVETLDILISEAREGREIGMEKLMTILRLMKEGNPYTFIVHYFNNEQFKNIASRFDSPDTYGQFMENAKGLFVRLNTLYRQGADPSGKEGQELAEQWWHMVNDFTSGDPGLLETLVSSGKDIDNWPEESKNVQIPIRNFLTRALDIYLRRIGVQLKKTEAHNHD